MELLGDVDRVESHYGLFGDSITVGLFGDSVILVQDRCTFCVECTIGSKIILDAPDATPR
jgi:hypothetical protein